MEALDLDTIRKKVHEALSEIIDEEDPEYTVLAGWVLIFEGVHMDDERSLTVVSSNATGEEHSPPWTSTGYLHHVIDNYEYYEYSQAQDVDEATEDTED